MKDKKKIIIIIIATLAIVFLLLISLFFWALTPVSKSNETLIFEVKKGDGKDEIIANLKNEGLIRSKYVTLLYVILTGNKNIQAGSYEFSPDMSSKDIIKSLNNGDTIKKEKPANKVTFVEGITLKKCLELIAGATNLEYDDMIKEINNKKFLQDLIDKYWFLTDEILNKDIYYALEGYIFPETYYFYEETTLKQVMRKILDETAKKLKPYKEKIKESGLSVHEVLTIASIAEKEANSKEDREKVSQVVFKRLELNMSLGMDVTTYYGVNKDMKEKLTVADLNDKNPYNTRITTFLGLPVGPICNPSETSIAAALNPADTNYIYFFADVSTGKVYFTDKASEFEEFKRIYG